MKCFDCKNKCLSGQEKCEDKKDNKHVYTKRCLHLHSCIFCDNKGTILCLNCINPDNNYCYFKEKGYNDE